MAGVVATTLWAWEGGFSLTSGGTSATARIAVLAVLGLLVAGVAAASWWAQAWALLRLPDRSRAPRVVLAVLGVLAVLADGVLVLSGLASPTETVFLLVQVVALLVATALLLRPSTRRDPTLASPGEPLPAGLGPDAATARMSPSPTPPPPGAAGPDEATVRVDPRRPRHRQPVLVAVSVAALALVPSLAIVLVGGSTAMHTRSAMAQQMSTATGHRPSVSCSMVTGLAVAVEQARDERRPATMDGPTFDYVANSAPDGPRFTTPGIIPVSRVADLVQRQAAQMGGRVTAACGADGQGIMPYYTGAQVSCTLTDVTNQHLTLIGTLQPDGWMSWRRGGS